VRLNGWEGGLLHVSGCAGGRGEGEKEKERKMFLGCGVSVCYALLDVKQGGGGLVEPCGQRTVFI
jgi:hypothetical protein